MVDKKRRDFKVHRLVMEAFVGPCPEGLEVLHWDDNPANNHLSNLRYGTRSENVKDRVRNGIHHFASRTHCLRGHEFTLENTYNPPGHPTKRMCRKCCHIRQVLRRKRIQMKGTNQHVASH